MITVHAPINIVHSCRIVSRYAPVSGLRNHSNKSGPIFLIASTQRSFPGSAWERTAFEAQPRHVEAADRRCDADKQAEPAIHWVPRQSLGTSTGEPRELSKPDSNAFRVIGCERLQDMKRRQQIRSGNSLIEFAILLPILAGLLALSGIVIQRAYQLHESSVRHWAHQQAIQLLYERWSADIHAHTLIVIPSEGVLELRGESVVIYTTNAEQDIVRQLWKHSKLVGIDEFQLGKSIHVTFTQDDTGAIPLIGMKIKNTETATGAVLATCFARLGIDSADSTRSGQSNLGDNLEN